MPKLPILSGKELIRILEKAGFEVQYQKGSHVILKRNRSPHIRLPVPNHKTIKQGLLRAIIREAGLTREEFLMHADNR